MRCAVELVRDRWYIVLEADEVRRGRPLGVTRHGEPMVFWRDAAGHVRCASDICPHRGASLAQGEVVDGEIACPFHGFRFRGDDGRCTHIPAQGRQPPPTGYGVRTWITREAHGFVWLWWGEPRDDLPPIPWFTELDEPRWRWRAGRFHDDWPIHWTRVVENQLDFTHLAFVHRTSIGRFVIPETVVALETDGRDYLKATVTNQPNSTIELVAPNLWRNKLGERTYAMAVFVPIDERNTRTYLRYYQADVPWPGLSWMYGVTMRWANRWILSQDRRVVTRQLPSEARLRNGEKLVASDAPIVWFRKWFAREIDPDRGSHDGDGLSSGPS